MKRVGYIWPQVLDWANLRLAYHRAARGKGHKLEVRRFAADLDANLELMRAQLVDGSFTLGRYHTFEVHEPKKRTIHAARFPERVFHHALMNVCEPVFERHLIDHSYACRKGKGRLKALHHAGRLWYVRDEFPSNRRIPGRGILVGCHFRAGEFSQCSLGPFTTSC